MGYPIYHSAYTAAQIEASIGKTPRIKAATRTWEVWDIATSAYVDTGVSIDTELYIDPTLSISGYAADAKVTGDRLGDLKSQFETIVGEGFIENITGNVVNGSFAGEVGSTITVGTSSSWKHTNCSCAEGEHIKVKFQLNTYTSSDAFVILTDSSDIIKEKLFTIPNGTNGIITGNITIPAGVAKIYVRSGTTVLEVYKYTENLTESISNLYNIVGNGTIENITGNLNDGSISGDIGSTISIGTQSAWKHTSCNCEIGDIVSIKFQLQSYTSSGAYVILTNSSDTIIEKLFAFPGRTNEIITKIITIPANVAKIYVRSGTTVLEVYKRIGSITDYLRNDRNKSLQEQAIMLPWIASKNKMLFSAHRGAEGQAPYGSYPAYKLACEQGWDILQIAAARQSKDGTWYVLHDSTVDAQTNGTGSIASLTDTEINALYQDVGVNIGQYTHEEMRLPTLESILQLARIYGTNISIRSGSLPYSYETEAEKSSWDSFIDLMEQYGGEKFMYSAGFRVGSVLKKLRPNWHLNIYLSGDEYDTPAEIKNGVDRVVSLGWKNVSIMAISTSVSKELINYIHRCGFIYMATQSDTPTLEHFAEMSNMGTDIQQTGISPIHSLLPN